MNDLLRVEIDPKKLTVAMAEKGLTVASLAEKIGKSRTTVNFWINARTLTTKQACILAKGLEVEVKDLI